MVLLRRDPDCQRHVNESDVINIARTKTAVKQMYMLSFLCLVRLRGSHVLRESCPYFTPARTPCTKRYISVLYPYVLAL